MKTDKERANDIFTHLRDKCGGSVLDMQGACAILAMHIYIVCNCTEQNVTGGYLTSSTGWRRAHWWIEKGGIVYDPMGDCYTCEPGFKRVVEHRGKWDYFVAEYEKGVLEVWGNGMIDYNLHMGSGMILVGVGIAIEVISTMVGNVTYQKIGIVPIMMGLILFLYGLEMSRK